MITFMEGRGGSGASVAFVCLEKTEGFSLFIHMPQSQRESASAGPPAEAGDEMDEVCSANARKPLSTCVPGWLQGLVCMQEKEKKKKR